MLPFIIGIVPGLILMFLVWKHDKIEREPIGLIIKLMIAGAVFSYPYIETLAADFVDSFNLSNRWLYAFIQAFLIIGLFEEALKYFVFDLVVWKSEEFDHTFDAIVYSFAFSAGFALFETANYILASKNMMYVAILRDLTSVPGHLFWAIYMGYYLGIAKQYEKKGNKVKCRKYRILALVIPVLFHGFYDFCCLAPSAIVQYIVFYGFYIVFAGATIINYLHYAEIDAPVDSSREEAPIGIFADDNLDLLDVDYDTEAALADADFEVETALNDSGEELTDDDFS